MDAETFSPNGGSIFFDQARQIVNIAQSTSQKGWKPSDGIRNRFWLIDSLRSNTFREYRQSLFVYHRDGLDTMVDNPESGKISIMKAINNMETLFQRRPMHFYFKFSLMQKLKK